MSVTDVLEDPPVAWSPDDIAGWREQQFLRMGFKGNLLKFLAESRIDLHAVELLVRKGCDPVFAVRIEAGKDFAGDDVHFNHDRFDQLLEQQAASKDLRRAGEMTETPMPTGPSSLLFGDLRA